ncbi:MAG: hypothetical protein WC966_08210, partial [Bradymonadales bacterium]
ECVTDPDYCVDGTPDSCANNEEGYGVVTKCVDNVLTQASCLGSCADNACGVCKNDVEECNSDTQYRTCVDGTWMTDDCEDSTPVCVVEGDDVLGCKECNTVGETRCIQVDDGEYSIAATNTCTAEYTWSADETCTSGKCNAGLTACAKSCTSDADCTDAAETKCGTDNVCVEPGGEPVINLFFSEYIEGSSFNKALEVYNAGTEAVDLETAACKILTYTDGNMESTSSIALTGTVAVKGVHVIIHADANEALKDAAGASKQEGALMHNGNDAVVLECGEVVMDVIGQIGHNGIWSVDGVSTQNMTLVRKCNIDTGDKIGDDTFDPSAEWVAYPQDTFDYLGNRESGCEDPAPACTTDADCTDAAATKCGTGDPKVCEALDVSWGKTTGYNADTLIMWGEVYYANHEAQTNDAPNPVGAQAKIFCTEDITASPSVWDDSGVATLTGVENNNNFEFSGMVSLSTEDRHCVLAFSGDGGANWKYAKGGAGGLVEDLSTLAAADAVEVAGVTDFTELLMKSGPYNSAEVGADKIFNQIGVTIGTAGESSDPDKNNPHYNVAGLTEDVDLTAHAFVLNVFKVTNVNNYKDLQVSFKYASNNVAITDLAYAVYDGDTLVGTITTVSEIPKLATTNIFTHRAVLSIPNETPKTALQVRIAAKRAGAGTLRLDDIAVTGVPISP